MEEGGRADRGAGVEEADTGQRAAMRTRGGGKARTLSPARKAAPALTSPPGGSTASEPARATRSQQEPAGPGRAPARRPFTRAPAVIGGRGGAGGGLAGVRRGLGWNGRGMRGDGRGREGMGGDVRGWDATESWRGGALRNREPMRCDYF